MNATIENLWSEYAQAMQARIDEIGIDAFTLELVDQAENKHLAEAVEKRGWGRYSDEQRAFLERVDAVKDEPPGTGPRARLAARPDSTNRKARRRAESLARRTAS